MLNSIYSLLQSTAQDLQQFARGRASQGQSKETTPMLSGSPLVFAGDFGGGNLGFYCS